LKTVRSIRLYKQKADKTNIIEIELCSIDPSQFLVNYREGIYGQELKEGTKTVFPVAYDRAFAAYSDLIKEKRLFGFIEKGEEPDMLSNSAEFDTREEYILNGIKQIANKNYRGKWKASRLVWRCGELKIKPAAGHLSKIVKKATDNFLLYSALFALCKTGSAEFIDDFKNLTKHSDSKINKLAQAATAKFSEADSAFFKDKTNKLPAAAKLTFQDKNCDELLKQLLETDFSSAEAQDLLWNLYLLSIQNEELKTCLRTFILQVPIKAGIFKCIRAIFKASEMLDDHCIWSAIACRMDSAKALFDQHWGQYINGQYIRPKEELKKADSKLAFSIATKRYMSYRILRRFNKLADSLPDDFISIATEYLLCFSPEMGSRILRKQKWEYDRESQKYLTSTLTYPPFSEAVSLFFLLYYNCNSYSLRYKSGKWVHKEKEGQTNCTGQRTEALPELWDNSPSSIIKLMTTAKLPIIVEFAQKVFNANPSFTEKASTADCALLILSGKQELIDTAKKIITNICATNRNLLAAPELIVAISLSTDTELGDWFMEKCPEIPADKQHLAFEEIIQKLHSNKNLTPQQAYQSAQFCIKLLPKSVSDLNEDIFNAIFKQPSETTVLFGIKLLSASRQSKSLDPELMERFLNSKSKFVNIAALELLALLDEGSIKNHIAKIAQFCFSANEELRNMALKVRKSIGISSFSFNALFSKQLVKMLLHQESNQGQHERIYEQLKSDLWQELSRIDFEKTLELISSSFDYAQKLGEDLYFGQKMASKLDIAKAIILSKSASKRLRQESWKYFSQNTSRAKYEIETSLLMLNSEWQDTRMFAFSYFEANFGEREWTPELLIAICDNIKPDVQSWGRSLISTFFKHENGREYLLKLSQHPSTNMQLFASNYIENFAGGSTKTILELKPYFKTVLTAINKGRICKERIIAFLQKELIRDKKVAEMTLDLFTDLSLTIAKGDKAKSIMMLLEIKKRYPEFSMPLTIKPSQKSHSQNS